jgi:hypothetical protein
LGVAVAVVVPVSVYYLQKKKKSLIFEELQNLSVINIKNDFKDKIEIKYANKLVTNLFVLTAKIKNNGNTSIKKNDIVSPVRISFNENFIECIVIGSSPEGIEINLQVINDNTVECDFNLLNPRDHFTLQFMSLERLSIPKIVSRIDGLSKVKYNPLIENENRRLILLLHSFDSATSEAVIVGLICLGISMLILFIFPFANGLFSFLKKLFI